MARITAGIATSHVPAIGAAFDQGRTRDEYWKPVFDAYEWVKRSNTDGWSTQKAVGSMTGMTPDEYAAMMRAGGRPIEGNRSIKGGN